MQKILQHIEKKETNFLKIFFYVFIIATLRNIVELLITQGELFKKDFIVSIYNVFDVIFVHFNLFWIAIFLVLSLNLYLFSASHNTVDNVLKVGAIGMLIIFFPLLFDMLFGTVQIMKYPSSPLDFINKIDKYFSLKPVFDGITAGMRYEVFIVVIFSFYYVYVKTHNIIKSFFASILSFLLIFAFAEWISFFGILFEGISFKDTENFLFTSCSLYSGSHFLRNWQMSVSLIYLYIIIILMALFFYLKDKRKFLIIIKNLRPERLGHYLLLFFFGFFTAVIIKLPDSSFSVSIFLDQNPLDYLALLGGAISVFFAFESGVVLNDINDVEADKMTNPDRPLVTGKLDKQSYARLGMSWGLISLYFAYVINSAMFFYILGSLILSFLYSDNFFAFKKILFVNYLTIGLIAFFVFNAGLSVVLGDNGFKIIPKELFWSIILGYSAGSIIKDFKDYESDKKTIRLTIPVVFGIKKGKIITVIIISAVIYLLPLFLGLENFWIVSLVLSILYAYLFLFTNINDKQMFLLYYIYVIFVFAKYFQKINTL